MTEPGEHLEFRLLGPFEVRRDGVPLAAGGPHQRALLAALALRPGRVVSVDGLAAEVWADDPPPTALTTLRSMVSRLRSVLGGSHLIRAQPPGYVLEVAPELVDAWAFDRLVGRAREAAAGGEHGVAAGLLETALALWRGTALGGLGGLDESGSLRAEAARFDEARLNAVEDLAAAELSLGRPEAALARLEAHVGAWPLRERACGHLMLALYRLGRQGDALAAYGRARATLAEELGVDPTPSLRDLQDLILRQDPVLDAPAARAPHPRRTTGNLAEPLSEFVGRAAELRSLVALLGSSRLITLTGIGGVGKTRLALAAATAARASFADGVWLVDLAPLREADQIAPTVVAALGMSTGALRSEAGLAGHLAELFGVREILLVLDNCEHLVEGAAALAATLLAGCPGLRVLATSREVLDLPGEVVWPVPAMSLPPEHADPSDVARADAAALFCARAAAARPGFVLTPENAGAVASVCRRLDGLPLAIELAAARIRILSASQIASQLTDDRFGPLGDGPRNVTVPQGRLASSLTVHQDPRRRTLRAAFEWSHRLLPAAEQVALRRLAAFPTSFDLPAARAVLAAAPGEGPALPPGTALDLLGGLADRSWLVVLHAEGGARYRLLETVQQFGAEQLGAAGETFSTHRRHRDFYLALARSAGVLWFDDVDMTAVVDQEAGHLRAALEWSIQEGEAEAALWIAATLAPYWLLTSKVEGIALLERALDCPGQAAGPARAEALSGLGMVLANAHDVEDGRPDACFTAARELALRIGAGVCAARALWLQGERALFRGDTARARELIGASRAEWPDMGPVVSGWFDMYLGEAALVDGDPAGALAHFDRALPRASGAGLLGPQLRAAMAPLHARAGDRPRARRLATEAVSSARAYPLPTLRLPALGRAAQTFLLCDELDDARRTAGELLDLLRHLGCWHWVADALDIAAVLAERAGGPATCLRLSAAGRALRVARGERADPAGVLAAEVDAAARRAAAALGPGAAAEAKADGAALRVPEALSAAAAALRPGAT